MKLDRKEDNGEQSGIRHEGIVHSDQSTDEAGTTAVILNWLLVYHLKGLLFFIYVELLLRVL